MTVILMAAASPAAPPVARTTLVVAPGGLVDFGARAGAGQLADLRVEIRELDGTVLAGPFAPWIETPVAGEDVSDYLARVKVPDLLGSYLVVWIDPEGVEADEPLTITGWTPTPTDVAQIVSAHTREPVTGGYERLPGDLVQAGRELRTFTASTDPTLEQVTGYIGVAADEILGRIGGLVEMPVRVYRLARVTAEWRAAAMVVAKRQPAQTADPDGSYANFMASYNADLTELIRQARPRRFMA